MAATDAQIDAAIRDGLIKVITAGEEYQLPDGTRVRRAGLDALLGARRELANATDVAAGCVWFQDPVAFGRE